MAAAEGVCRLQARDHQLNALQLFAGLFWSCNDTSVASKVGPSATLSHKPLGCSQHMRGLA